MTKIGYIPGKSIKNNVSYFLELHACKNPNKPLFYWLEQEQLKKITYGDFTKIVSHVAGGYMKLGIKPGDRAIVFIPMTINLYLAISALQRIGAIPVFLDSWTRHAHLGIAIQQVQPKAVLSFEKAFQFMSNLSGLNSIPIKISEGPVKQKYTARLEELINNPSHVPIIPVEQEDTALITFTTGSSGLPKGADRTHRFLASQHYALNNCIPYKEKDIDLPIFPIFSLNNVASGITTVLPAIDISTPKPTDSAMLLNQIKSRGVNCATLSPSLFNNLATYCIENKLEIPQLRRVVTGGAPVSRNNVVNFKSIAKKAGIVVLYGSTEVEPISQINAEELLSFRSQEDDDHERVDEGVNVGHVVPGLKYKLIKISKNPIKINSEEDWIAIEISKRNEEIGELVVTGEHVCQKYYKNPEAFNRAKIVDIDGAIWHRTGDLVRVDKNGYFWIVGRVHNAIQRAGIYIFPVQAEVVLKKLPYVAQAAYLGIPDFKLGEKAIVVVEPKEKISLLKSDNKEIWESKIRDIFAKNSLPIDSILFVDSIPMDPRHHSKVEYNQLRQKITGIQS